MRNIFKRLLIALSFLCYIIAGMFIVPIHIIYWTITGKDILYKYVNRYIYFEDQLKSLTKENEPTGIY